jgi:hypothetical protein
MDHQNDVAINGAEYVSSKDAATLSGYCADYLDQLCRLKKIKGRLVGHDWYMNKEEVLLLHKKHHQSKKMKVMLVMTRLKRALTKVEFGAEHLLPEQFKEVSANLNELSRFIYDEWAPL